MFMTKFSGFRMTVSKIFLILGLHILTTYHSESTVLLTANIADLKKLAKNFVSDALVEKITNLLTKPTDNKDISEENVQNTEIFQTLAKPKTTAKNKQRKPTHLPPHDVEPESVTKKVKQSKKHRFSKVYNDVKQSDERTNPTDPPRIPKQYAYPLKDRKKPKSKHEYDFNPDDKMKNDFSAISGEARKEIDNPKPLKGPAYSDSENSDESTADKKNSKHLDVKTSQKNKKATSNIDLSKKTAKRPWWLLNNNNNNNK